MSPRIASLLIPLLLLPAAAAGAQPPAATPYQVVEGIASVAWGDPHPALGGGSPLRLTVVEATGLVRAFYFAPGSPAFDFEPRRLQGRRVRVLFDPGRGPGAEPLGVLVIGADAPDAPALSGSQPWISLMCKFADVAAEPHNLAFFTQMFDNSPGRLDHYWREVSYDLIDVVGSGAYGWVVLPGNQTVYVPTPGSGCLDGDPNNDADLDLLFADCTAVADPFVDFSLGGTGGYVGINLMFNGDLDGCAWGGGMTATLDGVNKNWRTTWEPPWGYQNVSVMAHEMGHGFGLPHSNNWDNDGSPYDNSWDVMSDAWNYAASDPTYGTLGKHTIGYHKDLLDWFTAAEVWTPPGNGVYSIVVSDHALPTALGYRMAKLPIPSTTRYWTLETRDRTGLYDAQLPGHAVVVHEVYPSRAEDAWCYDAGVPVGNFCNGAGTMWTVGETFQDPTAGRLIAARVDAQTTDGFALTVWYGVPTTALFLDGFETGDTTRWSAAVP